MKTADGVEITVGMTVYVVPASSYEVTEVLDDGRTIRVRDGGVERMTQARRTFATLRSAAEFEVVMAEADVSNMQKHFDIARDWLQEANAKLKAAKGHPALAIQS